MSPNRRALLGAAAAVPVLGACGAPSRSQPDSTRATRRVRYGDHPSQFADLRRPTGPSRGTVVLLHGGYWGSAYGLDLMEPLASRLSSMGFTTWNVEYRRVGDGGGFPETLGDVAAAVDRLAHEGIGRAPLLLGHSAGGQLAVWAASRTSRTPGGPPVVVPRAVVSLSGVLDLTRAATAPGSAEPVTALMGGPPGGPGGSGGSYALADPSLLVPAQCPVEAVHARQDEVVPLEQSTSYVAHARKAGGVARRVLVPGDHFSLIDPGSSCFATIRGLLLHPRPR